VVLAWTQHIHRSHMFFSPRLAHIFTPNKADFVDLVVVERLRAEDVVGSHPENNMDSTRKEIVTGCWQGFSNLANVASKRRLIVVVFIMSDVVYLLLLSFRLNVDIRGR
jgi:hypothetical protein